MDPQTFIIIGASGSGKGTQSHLLLKYLQDKDPNRPRFYLETGEHFREFVAGEGYSNKLAKAIQDRGQLQPEFLAILMWGQVFIDRLKGGEHLIMDGVPRKVHEAEVLESAFDFYGMKDAHVIYLQVSREWAKERMMGRGRADDVRLDSIEDRLDWFESEVLPTVDFFKNSSRYNFIEINGEQSIEVVNEEIVQKLGF